MIDSNKYVSDSQLDALYDYSDVAGPVKEHRARLRAVAEFAIAAHMHDQHTQIGKAIETGLVTISNSIEQLTIAIEKKP